MSDLFSGARHWYEKGGFSSLLRSSAVYASGSAVTKLASGGYSGLLAESKQPTELGEQYWELKDEVEELSEDIYAELASFAAHEKREFRRVPDYDFRQPFLIEANNVYLTGPHATAITENTVFGDAIRTNIDKTRWMLNEAITSSPRRVGSVLFNYTTPPSVKQIDTACVLYHQTGNFYHWVIEQFPKLWAVERYEAETGNEVTLIIKGDTPPYVEEFLNLFDHQREQVWWNGDPCWIKNLVVPSLPEPTPGSLGWLQKVATESTSDSKNSEGWVYVSRQNASRGRRVANWEELRSVLEQNNVTIIRPEQLSMAEQMEIFSRANGVIGPHGAGMTGIVWGKDLEVVEIFNDVVKPSTYLLSAVLGHGYSPIVGEGCGSSNRKINQSIAVNTDTLSEIF